MQLVQERRGRSELAAPQSLHALIAARLDTLSPPERALVQDAAVVGEVFWVDALAAIGASSLAAIDKSLRALERRQFVSAGGGRPLPGNLSTPSTTSWFAIRLAQIQRAERGSKHRAAAEWIESLGRREDHAELLAHHYQRALELARAAGETTTELERRTCDALRAAGEHAAGLWAMDVAARHFAAALELLPDDHPRPAGTDARARTRTVPR